MDKNETKHITSIHVATKYVVSYSQEDHSPSVAVYDDYGISHSYDLVSSRFYDDLLNVDHTNQSEVLDFCAKYGIPINPDRDNTKLKYFAVDYLLKPQLIERAKLSHIQSEIADFHTALKIWCAIQEDNTDEIQHYSNLLNEKYALPHDWHIDTVPDGFSFEDIQQLEQEYKSTVNYKAMAEVTEKPDKIKTQQYLALIVTEKLNTGSVLYGLRPINGTLSRIIAFSAPLDYAWWKLSKDIISKTSLPKCLHCGRRFTPTRNSQLFCTQSYSAQHSKCENTHSQRYKRNRERIIQLYNEGVSIPNIGKETNIHPAYIAKQLSK